MHTAILGFLPPHEPMLSRPSPEVIYHILYIPIEPGSYERLKGSARMRIRHGSR